MVNFSFEFGSVQMQEAQSGEYDYLSEKYAWTNELKQEYINRHSDESTKPQLSLLNSKISECIREPDVQSCVLGFAK